jgi:hypothetical protein
MALTCTPSKAAMSSITLRFLAEPGTVNFGGKVHSTAPS